MSKINWLEKLKWSGEQLDDLQTAGFAYIRQGKYDIALPIFEALVVLDPENAYNPQTLGAIYIQLNNPLKALKHLNHALQLEAEHAPTLLNLTKALFMLGKVEEGLRLANILKNEPDPLISNPARALLIAYQ